MLVLVADLTNTLDVSVSGGTVSSDHGLSLSVQRDALGAMDECLMSLYGITRLLGARDLGPKQLKPALESFGVSLGSHCELVEGALSALKLQSVGSASLSAAIATLAKAMGELSNALCGAFDRDLNLRASERLDLERSATCFGVELQAYRELFELVGAALEPRPVQLTAADALTMGSDARLSFVGRQVGYQVTSDTVLSADPVVLRMLLREGLQRLAGAHTLVVASADERASITMTAVSSPIAGDSGAVMPLPTPSTSDAAVVAGVARHLGVEWHSVPGGIQLVL